MNRAAWVGEVPEASDFRLGSGITSNLIDLFTAIFGVNTLRLYFGRSNRVEMSG